MPPNEEIESTLVGWLWIEVKGFFEAMFESVWYGLTNIIPSAVEATWDTIHGRIAKKQATTVTDMFDAFVSAGLIRPEHSEVLKTMAAAAFPFDFVIGSAISINLLFSYLKMVTTTVGGQELQRMNKYFSPNPPDPGSMINAAFIAPEKTGEIRDAMRRTGLSEEDIDLMFIAAYRLYDVTTIREYYYREGKDKDKAYERLREHGLTDTRIEELMKTWDVIPPIVDILTMVAKEAFEPDMVERYGLGAEFPEEQSSWLEKQGLSRYWQEKYWASHWDYPGPGQVLEMLHRGLITEEEVYEFYRVVEMPPYWREKLMKISFVPYTRVDARRMHSMGVLSDEELSKVYQDMGYDLEHAEKMAEFTIRYNAKTSQDLTQAQVVKGYKNKLITRESATELLGLIGLGADKIDYLLTAVDFDEYLEAQDDILKAIQDQYINQLIDKNEALDKLGKLNLPAIKVDSLLERWDVRRYITTKIPSKTDLDKFLRNKIINEDRYRSEMERLGYGWEQVDWYLSLIKKGKAG